MISRKKAWIFFREYALPRRARDYVDEVTGSNDSSSQHVHYRKVGPEEEDRGEPYPLCHDGINTFGHFGIGIGIYFAQLVILAAVCFVGGFIVLTGGVAYNGEDYGIRYPTVPLSAACAMINVTATANCIGGDAECQQNYRPNCELPYSAAAADLAMCFLLAFTILVSKLVESQIEVKLDESIQTVQDYSIEVLDPDHDADDPDEWQRFFSQFGAVAYITIVRRNSELTSLLLRKHQLALKLKESSVFGSSIASKRDVYMTQYHDVSRQLAQALQGVYPVCRVFVTFEYEAGQRKCIEELEVPDMQALLDTRYVDNVLPEHRFRGVNVLNIREPPEPDNIIWKNVEINSKTLWAKKGLSIALSISLFVAFWFIVIYCSSHAVLLALVIGIIDSLLPMVLTWMTDLLTPLTEGARQSSLQMRLFGARLMLSTLIPYIQSSWTEVLSDDFITRAFIVQVSACLTSPIIALCDVQGLFYRHVLAYTAETQRELNGYFQGTEWSLAEKYTGIARVLFVSLFYSLLTPLSLLLCSVTFVVIFCIDNYLLLRRWKAPSMLDSKIAVRLRQQAVLAVAAHMYCSLRYIYSWPMDQVSLQSDGSFAAVDKNPPLSPLRMQLQPWQSPSQQSILSSYRTCWVIVALVALYLWILEPLSKFLFRMLCYNLKTAGHLSSQSFSASPSMRVYFPVLEGGHFRALCSFTKYVLYRHRPQTTEALSMEKDDLSSYVPIARQPKVLSVVKFYGHDAQAADSWQTASSSPGAGGGGSPSTLPAHGNNRPPRGGPEARSGSEAESGPPRGLVARWRDRLHELYYHNVFVPLAYHYERVGRRKRDCETAPQEEEEREGQGEAVAPHTEEEKEEEDEEQGGSPRYVHVQPTRGDGLEGYALDISAPLRLRVKPQTSGDARRVSPVLGPGTLPAHRLDGLRRRTAGDAALPGRGPPPERGGDRGTSEEVPGPEGEDVAHRGESSAASP